MRCEQTRATRGAVEDVRSVATSRSDTPGAPWFTHVLRGVAVAIAIAAAIDPAITSTRRTRPLIAVVAADAIGDSGLVTRVRRELDASFTVVPAALDVAAGTVLIGDRVPDRLREGDAPVVAVASRDAAGPSVRLRRVVAPARATLDARIAVSMTLDVRPHATSQSTSPSRSQSTTPATVQLELRAGDRVVSRERVTVGHDSVFTRALAFVPTRAAATLLEARAFVVGGADTVRHHLLVDVRAERWSVLFFDRRPSWMSTFVRRALERDPRFAVTSRIITSTNVSRETGSAPLSLDAITAASAFDAVVVGAPDALSARDVDGLFALLRTRGASVLVLADRAAPSPLDARLGFGGWRTVVRRTPAAIVSAPASAGVREPLRLRGIAIGTPARLPAAADVFAVVEGDTLRASRAPGATSGAPLSPVIWRMPVGSGQVIVSGAFDAWRYRDTAQSTFDATWRDLVDEAASAREPRLDLQPSRTLVTPRADLSVALTARDTAALAGARLSLRRARSDSTWDTPQLIGSRVTGQTRLATMRAPLTPGVYELIAANGIDSARAPLHVLPQLFRDGDDAPALVGALASSRGGQVIAPSRLPELNTLLAAAVRPAPERIVWHPMRSPWWMLPFALALAGEWWFRRRRGLA